MDNLPRSMALALFAGSILVVAGVGLVLAFITMPEMREGGPLQLTRVRRRTIAIIGIAITTATLSAIIKLFV